MVAGRALDRESRGDWFEWTDLGLGFMALLLFRRSNFPTTSLSVFSRWTTAYHLRARGSCGRGVVLSQCWQPRSTSC